MERIGVERSENTWKNADVTLLVLDGSSELTEEDKALAGGLEAPGIIVINKSDLPEKLSTDDIADIQPQIRHIRVSAKNTESLEPLKDELRRYAEVSDSLALTQPRQLDAARRAVSYLKDALNTLDTLTPDMASTDLQSAQDALSEITGDRADEKLLDRVFSQFCVGT